MTQDLLTLIDTFAEAETSFWFGLDEVGTKFDTDARRNRDQARAAVVAAIDAMTKDARLGAYVAQAAAACPECGSTDTEWHCSQRTNSGVADGRLRMHDVHTVFFLGCNECSETIRTISGDKLARLLTEAAAQKGERV